MISGVIKINISDDFFRLRKKGFNENLVLEIINSTSYMFRGKGPFTLVKSQSHGEPDFENTETGYSLDAKLFLPKVFWDEFIIKSDGQYTLRLFEFHNLFNNLIGLNSREFQVDVPDPKMIECISKWEIKIVKHCKIKNIVLFFPLCVLKEPESLASRFSAGNPIEVWLQNIVDREKFVNDIYLIAPNTRNVLFIKKINRKYEIEYLDCDIRNLIDFQLNT